jgi:hypothetical protein
MTTDSEHAYSAFDRLSELGKRSRKNYGGKSRSNNTDETRLLDEPRARQLRATRDKGFLTKLWTAVERRDYGSSKLRYIERGDLRRAFGGSPDQRDRSVKAFSCLAANPHARAVFFDEAYARLQNIHAEPSVKMYFATIVDRAWCLPKDAQSFDPKSMMRRTTDALREIGWDGILFLEIQAVTDFPAGRFCAHLHGFVWRKPKQGMKVMAAKELLNRRFSGIGHAKGAVLALVPQRHPKALPTRFFYSTKLPYAAKAYVLPDANGCAFASNPEGKQRQANSKNYTDFDALRIAGILSQHQIDATAVAVGEGTKVRKAASAKLTAKVMAMRRPLPDPTPASCLAVISKLLRVKATQSRREGGR